MMERQAESMKERGLPEISTVENPPGSAEKYECPSWELPEIKTIMGRMKASEVEFNTCAYMTRSKTRFFKPAKWAGKLQDMGSLSRVCRCPNWVTHTPVVGAVSVQAGVYPDELCESVAERIIATWKRILSLEFYRHLVETKGHEISSLQKQWLANEDRRSKRSWETMTKNTLPEMKEPKAKLQAGEVAESVHARAMGPATKKERKEQEDKFFVGGMRNPTQSVRRLWKLKSTGQAIKRAWDDYVKRSPHIVKLGFDYGTNEAQFDEAVAAEWKAELEKILKVKPKEGVRIRDNLQFKSPLNAELWEAWERESGDPEKWIGPWAEEGVPLGMAKPIPCSGVFPPSMNVGGEEDFVPEVEYQQGVVNYKSFTDNPQDAEEEVRRYVAEGFAVLIDKQVAAKRFNTGPSL